ncbi:MAG: WXG100 family type VII secretion target [Actinomycetia bacterium]|nr:WXG100 family type VII secretion target [Actinomycetes bacterium]
MALLVVDFDALRSAVEHMGEFDQRVKECLDDVGHTMANLRASWHGGGSDAQAQAQQMWEDGADQMKEALSALQKIADQAHENYAAAVAKNGEMWQA